MDCRKRVRRGESFGRMGVDRTISNSLKSPSRQKQKQRSVRFAEQTPFVYLCSNFDKDMTPEEMEQRKKELWYSRFDFEGFLQERISTVQLLKAVHGDAMLLRQHAPDLCLRGLEPYQCETLNQEMQCQRQLHQNVVLAEQSIQKAQNKKPDAEAICRLAQARSEWARERARYLASLDELEVKMGYMSLDDSELRRRSLVAAQLGLENLMLTQQRRRSSLSSLVSPPTSRRVPVDLAILKEWNAKFLKDIQQNVGSWSNSKLPVAVSSLSEKTAESRRALQHSLQLFSNKYTSGEDAKKNPSNTSSNDPSFRFPLRRDSLVGLRRESLFAAKTAAPGPAQLPASAPTPSLATLAAAAAAVSTSGTSEACFRFQVRRDSLSNIQWS